MYNDYALDVWELDWLTKRFKEEVIDKEMKQIWAIEEVSEGVPSEDIENLIWKDYPSWATQQLLDAKDYLYD